MSKSGSSVVKMNAAVTYTYVDPLGVSYSGNPAINITNTLGSDTVTKVYSSEATISTATAINLTSVTDAFGATLDFAHVYGIYVQNNSANQTLVIGGGTDPLCGSDQYTIGPGCVFFQNTTFTVTSGTAQTLTLTPGGSLNYTLIVVGAEYG